MTMMMIIILVGLLARWQS